MMTLETRRKLDELFEELEMLRLIDRDSRRARRPRLVDPLFDLLERLVNSGLGLLEKAVSRLVAAVLR